MIIGTGMATRAWLAVLIVLLLSARGRGQLDKAWWLIVNFEPRGASVEGIPIQQIDPSWVAASLLRDLALPTAASEPGLTLQDNDATFEILRDFNGDGRAEKVLVGVYKTRSGELGRFLLVLSSRPGGRWLKQALFKEAGKAGFSALLDRPRLIWTTCLECDNFCEVISRTGTWRLECA